MNYEAIIYTKEDGIATLTFNRPQAMNAGNMQLYSEMGNAMQDAMNDSVVRVLILTGAGRAFHAGDDVKEIFVGRDSTQMNTNRWLGYVLGTEDHSGTGLMLRKPTIAAVNGPAVGMGMDIALACDIRIASEAGRFAYLYVRRGIQGTLPGLSLLKEIVGLSKALEIMLSGEAIDATEALRIGLVSKVVPQEKLLEEANQIARKLMMGAPLAQQAIKRSVYKSIFDPYSLKEYIQSVEQVLWKSEDFAEGARSFVEKREPKFKGK